jgi:hypothetical protein
MKLLHIFVNFIQKPEVYEQREKFQNLHINIEPFFKIIKIDLKISITRLVI